MVMTRRTVLKAMVLGAVATQVPVPFNRLSAAVPGLNIDTAEIRVAIPQNFGRTTGIAAYQVVDGKEYGFMIPYSGSLADIAGGYGGALTYDEPLGIFRPSGGVEQKLREYLRLAWENRGDELPGNFRLRESPARDWDYCWSCGANQVRGDQDECEECRT